MPDQDPSFSLRAALGRYATGVAVVAAFDPQERAIGMTINSFASVSLEPPLVLWSVDRQSSCAQAFIDAPVFSLSILSADQQDLARRFADPGVPAEDRFDRVPLEPGVGEAPDIPVLAEAAAWFRCRRYAVYPGGDHQIILGEVTAFDRRDGATLLFHDGTFLSS